MKQIMQMNLLIQDHCLRNKHILSEEQQNAVSKINAQLGKAEYKSYLLHGITGSGKTEVYLNCAEDCLKNGGSAYYGA